MAVLITYQVDKELYYKPDTPHSITLITTEYSYKNEILVHLWIGKNIGIKISNLIQEEFENIANFHSEQFFFKKSYNEGRAKPTTRSTFEDKIKRFDTNQTATLYEVLEEYRYIGKDGQPDMVQIPVTITGVSVTVVICFKDTAQHENFVKPAWLV